MIYIEFQSKELSRIINLLSISNEDLDINFDLEENRVVLTLICGTFVIHAHIACRCIGRLERFSVQSVVLSSVLTDKVDQYWIIDIENNVIMTCSENIFNKNTVTLNSYISILHEEIQQYYTVAESFIYDLGSHALLSKINIVRNRQNMISMNINGDEITLFSTNSYILFVSRYILEAKSIKKKNISIYINMNMKNLSTIIDLTKLEFAVSERFLVIKTPDLTVQFYLVEPLNYSVSELLESIPSDKIIIRAQTTSELISQFSKVYSKSLETVELIFNREHIDTLVRGTNNYFTSRVENICEFEYSMILDCDTFKNIIDILKRYKTDLFIHLSVDIMYAYICFNGSYNTLIFTYKLNE